MANDSFRSMTSFPPPADEQFSISPEEDQADDVIDQASNDKNGLRQEKINKLVSDGAKNYPAYLKLIYTGESELSSEDETLENRPARLKMSRVSSSTAPSRHRQPLPAVTAVPVSRAHNIYTSDVSVSRPRSTILSPESHKLLDPGREKISSPSDAHDVVSPTTPTTEYLRSVGNTTLLPCIILANNFTNRQLLVGFISFYLNSAHSSVSQQQRDLDKVF